MVKVKDKTACRVHQAIRRRIQETPEGKIKSLTLDNGTEFALAPRLEQYSGIAVYWAQPGRPHQRGTNENTNGLIRQFFPKGSDFRLVYPRDVARVEKLLNFRPRASLGYRTPHEVENDTSLHLCCISS
jgi:IS30 family transposase